MGRVYLYPQNATVEDLERNGLPLTALSARPYEELLTADQSGKFHATVKISVRDPYAKDFKAGAILEMSTPENERELFRIIKTTKTLTEITATAWHISYDLRNYLIGDRAWTGQTLAAAWPDILQAGGANNFSGYSDIETVAGLRAVRRSVIDVTVDGNVSVVNRWGGELLRHRFEVNMLSRRGSDRGFQVRYGQNLTGISDEIDASETYHAVLPTYLRGETVPVVMDVIKSPLFDLVPNPRTVHVHFGDIRVGTDDGLYPDNAAAELEVAERVAELWIQGADKPRASATISFVDLPDSDLSQVHLGDTVRAIWQDQVDIEQRVISYEWDSLRDKYVAINLGDPTRSIASLRGQISAQIDDALESALPDTISTAVKAAQHLDDVYVNAMGYYSTVTVDEETGARTAYMHDQPTLDESQFIATIPEPGTYLWTETGWNGGDPVWTQGVTQDGNLLVRFIQTVGLSADWVETGILRGGKIAFNLDNGTFLIGNSPSDYSMYYNGATLYLGGNTKLSWANITNKPYIPPAVTLPEYITETEITSTTIRSPSIIGGTITGGRLTAISGTNQKVEVADGETVIFDGSTKLGSISSSKVQKIGQTDTAIGMFVDGSTQWKVGASDWTGGGFDSGTTTGSYGNLMGTSRTGNDRSFNFNTQVAFFNTIHQHSSTGAFRMSIIDGNIRAQSYVDATPAYTGNALSEIVKISDDGKGNINHDTLPKFAQVEFEIPLTDKEYEAEKKNEQMRQKITKVPKIEQGRDLGAMVSVLTKAVQELVEITEKQSDRIVALEKEVLNAK